MSQKTMLKHIKKHGTPRGLTLGRGRPHDESVVEKLVGKKLIARYLSDSPTLQADYMVIGDQDENGFSIGYYFEDRVELFHYGQPIGDRWKAAPDDENKASAISNGRDTAKECGYDVNDSWLFEAVSMAFAESTLETLEATN